MRIDETLLSLKVVIASACEAIQNPAAGLGCHGPSGLAMTGGGRSPADAD
ncbi:MAG: hypothetical protein INR64_15945 [Caulobacteraceae bacterium]|nr:hypothetical protein [Caulobacter sp.]